MAAAIHGHAIIAIPMALSKNDRTTAEEPVMKPEGGAPRQPYGTRRWDKLCDLPLQERPELFFTETGITKDASHRERVDGIVPGDGEDPNTVGHHDVLPLSSDPKACLLQGADGVLMVDTRNARHVLQCEARLTG
jgi:hypothetical protein